MFIMPNTQAELESLVHQLLSRVAELEVKLTEKDQIIATQAQVIKDLSARLKMDSSNSSKPPSSDGLKKKPAFARPAKGKVGGQEKHKGRTLEIVDTPDKVVVIKVSHCTCGTDLSGTVYQIVGKRQEFEIPVPKLEVTEYQITSTVCPCCRAVNRSSFPLHITAPVQYGVRAHAFVTMLNNAYRLSFESSGCLFDDMYGYNINECTIQTANTTCYQILAPVEQQIQQEIVESHVAHNDETGIRCQGKLWWLHVTCTGLFTYFFVHAHRGKQAIESEKSILQSFFGWLVHDCWSSYFGLTHLKHAICGAHLLRELQYLSDNGTQWATDFKAFLLEVYHTPIEQRLQNKQKIEAQYDLIVAQGFEYEPLPIKTSGKGKDKRTKGRNLLERLQKFKPNVLAFAFNEQVPFTNNQAERDIRPAKVKLKIAGSFRTVTGAEQYARIAGFISTVRKHKRNVFKELCKVFQGEKVSFSTT